VVARVENHAAGPAAVGPVRSGRRPAWRDRIVGDELIFSVHLMGSYCELASVITLYVTLRFPGATRDGVTSTAKSVNAPVTSPEL
jgi:hypothetical protein